MSNTTAPAALQGLLKGLVSEAALSTLGTDEAPQVATQDPITVVDPVDPFTLFDYQRDALEFIFRNPQVKHTYVGLDMGLGKSLVATQFAASLAPTLSQPVLVVTPPALRFNIVREFAKFAPQLTLHVIEASKPGDDPVDYSADVIVLGDSGLKGTTVKNNVGRKVFKPTGWTEELAGKVGAIVVDEVHRFKNDSTRAKALIHLGEHCFGYKVGMSGTPTPNGRNVELAKQIDFLGKDAWNDIGGRGQFWNYYAPTIDSWGTRGSYHSDELNEAMSNSWYLRMLRDDVQDLPNKGRSFVAVEGTGKGKRDYLAAERDLITFLREARDNPDLEYNPRSEALVKLTTLRRLAGVARVKGVAEHVKDVLDDVGDGGVFVVAEHAEVIDTLLVSLAKYNPVAIRGGMTDAQRAEAVDAFCSGESRVLVGQIISAGVGLTLHGGGRNYRVVFAQIPWTPADLRQAEDRLHRIGQTNDVHVEVTGCAMAEAEQGLTIDDRLWQQLEGKAFSAGVLQDGEGSFLLEEAQDAILDSYR